MGRFNWRNSYHHVHHTYTLNIHTHIMDLARGTYSSARVLVSACSVPSDRMGPGGPSFRKLWQTNTFHCPPKGDPKRRIRNKHMFKWLNNEFWVCFWSAPPFRIPLWGTVNVTVSCQTINMEKCAQPLGDLNFQRACWSEHKQWFWDLRPSIWNCANLNYKNWMHEHPNKQITTNDMFKSLLCKT